jgi:acyl-CoA thioesterase FadM
MNLWLRMIAVLLWLRGKPRVALLDTTRITLRVWPNDLDINRHVNNGRYLTLADLGRLDWFVRTGTLDYARRQQAWPIVGDAIAKFRRDLKAFQRFTLESRMLGWDEKWAFLEHRFVRGGRVLGVVAIRGLFRGPEGPIKPGEFLAVLGGPADSPPLPEWVLDWHRGCEAMSIALRAEEALQQTA